MSSSFVACARPLVNGDVVGAIDLGAPVVATACGAAVDDCPVGQACCDGRCRDLGTDPAHCGACDRACSTAHATATSCAGGTCAPSCADGWADCTTPEAPAADDGCEQSVHELDHCGSCSGTCSLANATASCASGQCSVAGCAAGFADCDGAAPSQSLRLLGIRRSRIAERGRPRLRQRVVADLRVRAVDRSGLAVARRGRSGAPASLPAHAASSS